VLVEVFRLFGWRFMRLVCRPDRIVLLVEFQLLAIALRSARFNSSRGDLTPGVYADGVRQLLLLLLHLLITTDVAVAAAGLPAPRPARRVLALPSRRNCSISDP
jgi:hypothetical protein